MKSITFSLIISLSAVAAATSLAQADAIQIHCSDTTYLGPTRIIRPTTDITVDTQGGGIAWGIEDLQNFSPTISGSLGSESPGYDSTYREDNSVEIAQEEDLIVIHGSEVGHLRAPTAKKVLIGLQKTNEVFPSDGSPIYLLVNFQYQNWSYSDGPEEDAPIQQLASDANRYCSAYGL